MIAFLRILVLIPSTGGGAAGPTCARLGGLQGLYHRAVIRTDTLQPLCELDEALRQRRRRLECRGELLSESMQ